MVGTEHTLSVRSNTSNGQCVVVPRVRKHNSTESCNNCAENQCMNGRVGIMNQYQYSQPYRKKSNSGCGRVAIFGGGCVVVLLLGFVGLLVAGGLLWDRGTEAGGNVVSNWVSEQIGTDISDRVDAVEGIDLALPEAREFDDSESYMDFLESYHKEFAASMQRVGELVSDPKMRDDEWSGQLAQEIALIRYLEEEAHQVTPPADMNEAHGHWTEGMGEYRRAMDKTASALDNASLSDLAEGIGALSSATRSYVQMGQILDDMGVLEDRETIRKLQEAQPEQ
jgi:hypothetical protein